MNVLKNMEAIFLAAAVLTSVTSYASAAGEHARMRQEAQAQAQAAVVDPSIPVVTVKAKRLSAAEKAGF